MRKKTTTYIRKPFGLQSSAFSLILLFTVFIGCAGRMAYHKGDDFASRGNWDEAVMAFTEAGNNEPDNLEYNIRLIMAKERASEQHYKKGAEAVSQEKIDDAIREFQIAAALNPSNSAADTELKKANKLKESRARYDLGVELEKQGKFAEAIAEYQEAYKIDSRNIRAKNAADTVMERQKKSADEHAQKDKSDKPLFSTKPVTLQLKDVQLKQAFEILAKTAGLGVLFDDGVKDVKISYFIKDSPFSNALDLMLRTNNLFKKQADDNTILIIPDTPAKRKQYEELVIQTFYLSNADAKKAVNMVRTLLNIRQVHVNEELNAVIVRDNAEKMALVKKLLDAADKPDAEVYLELELLEVSRTKIKELGLKLSQYSVSAGIAEKGAAKVGDLLTLGLLKDLSSDNFLFSIPSAAINFAKSEGLVKTLANPRIRVVNRKKARFAITERLPVAASTTSVAQTSTTSVTPEYKDVGVKIDIAPTIHSEDSAVTLEVKLEVSSLGEKITLQIEGKSTEAFSTKSRNAETFLRLKDGEKAVLAGLISDTERTSTSKIPFLSDIPLLGSLFSSKDNRVEETDILMAITPKIIRAMEIAPDEIKPIPSGKEDTYSGGALAPAIHAPIPALPTLQEEQTGAGVPAPPVIPPPPAPPVLR